MYDEYSRNSGKFYPLRYTRTFDIICLIVAGRREVTRQRLAKTFILNWFHVTKMLIQRCHINFFDSSFRLTSEKKAKAPLYWSFEMVTGGFFSQRVINAENVSVSIAAEKAKSWVAQRTTHDWWLGGPSQFWVVRQWYTEIFNPRPLRPKGYCRHRMRLSVHLSVCSHHPCWHNNSINLSNKSTKLAGWL